VSPLLTNGIAIGAAAFLYAAVVQPLIGRYSQWKNDPQREQVYRRNIFGRYTQDLRRKRIERTLWFGLALIFLFGLAVDFTIMMADPSLLPVQRP
jgi:hypothetical protein